MVTLSLWTVEGFSYTAKENTHKHWEKIQTSRNLRTLLLWGDSAHHCPTHSNFLFFISQGLSFCLLVLSYLNIPGYILLWYYPESEAQTQKTCTELLEIVQTVVIVSCLLLRFVVTWCYFLSILLQLWGIIKQGYKCKGIISLASSVKVFQKWIERNNN